MGTTDIDVGKLGPKDLDTPIAVATRAFWDDPMFNHFTRNLLTQHKNLPRFFGATLSDCQSHGEVWQAKLGPTVAGVAAWLPPGVFPPSSGTRALRQGLQVVPSVLRTDKRRTLFKLLNELTARHPHEEHWYLAVLATDPLFQGKGVGKSLVEPMLNRADDVGVPTYLETQKESNLAYYQRFGFDIVDEFSVDECPPIWTMQREAR
jgi:ribosomal protein S18 acetylase RimI-like enzyme